MTTKLKSQKIRRLVRYCVLADCGKKLNVIVYPDRTYSGGNYFFKLRGNSGKMVEYWECKDCYGKGSF